VRVGRICRSGLRRAHRFALVASLGGCDPNILLGARPVDELPDAFSEGGITSDGAISDRSAISDNGIIADSAIFDRGVISDSGAGSERSADAASTILWSADHETGDLSAWHTGGAASGGGQYQAGGQADVSRERAHGGYAAKLTIDTTDGADHTARLYRRTVSGGAYYSAWFFFAQAHTPDAWWSIFLFRVQRDPNDVETFVNLWDINVERPAGGSMTLSFFDHITGQYTRPATAVPLPIGQWTHLEAFFNYAPPDGTRITVWQDGQLMLDLAGLGQGPAPYFYWSIGNGSNGLSPRVSNIYIDDAAIATGRLGPGAGGG